MSSSGRSEDENDSGDHGDCGSRKISQKRSRIIGGNLIYLGEHPWLGVISKHAKVHCGCSLVNHYWSLSAAHCFSDTNLKYYQVYFGIISFDYENLGIPIEKVIQHENYGFDFRNDISLIKSKFPILYNDYIQPICINQKSIFANRKFATLVGFGESYDSNAKLNAKKLVIPVVDTSICNQPYIMNNQIQDGMMCAGEIEGGVDACQGDSGGPLIIQENEKSILVGIVSWGIGCALVNKLGVYTDVAFYHDWIETHLNKN